MDEEEEEEVVSIMYSNGFQDDLKGDLKRGYNKQQPSSANVTTGELIEMLQRLQSSRLDDQRCSLPGTLSDRLSATSSTSSTIQR